MSDSADTSSVYFPPFAFANGTENDSSGKSYPPLERLNTCSFVLILYLGSFGDVTAPMYPDLFEDYLQVSLNFFLSGTKIQVSSA